MYRDHDWFWPPESPSADVPVGGMLRLGGIAGTPPAPGRITGGPSPRSPEVAMARTLPLGVLEQVRIASPCSMPWDEMRVVDGDRVRHCAACNLQVYNLSGMSRAEAEALVLSRVGSRFCARLYRRTDGTVLTRDCPVGLHAARLRLTRAVARVAAALVFLLTGALLSRSRDRLMSMPGLARVQPFATLCDWVRPPELPGPVGPAPTRTFGARATGGFLMGSLD